MNLLSSKKNTWIIALNLSYADDIARLAYTINLENKITPKLGAFPLVKDKLKSLFYSQNIFQNATYENPFKLLIKNKSYLDEIIIVGPSYLSIFFIMFFKMRTIKVISVIHNHPSFKADNSFFKLILGKFIALSTIILSDNIIFTSPHIKKKWEITKIFKFFKLSKKCTSFERIFAFKDSLKKNKYIKTSFNLNMFNKKVIDIYSWGRSTPYKDLSILYKVFNDSQRYLNPALSLNIIHYGVTFISKPFFLNYENLVSKLSIINKRVSFDELKNIHLDADYIIFPYTDISQSGPIRYSRELGSHILVPKMDGSVEQLSDYEDKFLFNAENLESLFCYLNENHVN